MKAKDHIKVRVFMCVFGSHQISAKRQGRSPLSLSVLAWYPVPSSRPQKGEKAITQVVWIFNDLCSTWRKYNLGGIRQHLLHVQPTNHFFQCFAVLFSAVSVSDFPRQDTLD